MDDRTYYIIKLIADEGLYYPFWGVIRNVTTKKWFEADQQMFLSGTWIYAAVKTPKWNIKMKFDSYKLKPDAEFTNDRQLNHWYAWKVANNVE